MITYKGRSPEASECGSSLEQLRRIRKELSYYQQLSGKLSEEIKQLAGSKSDTLQELRVHHLQLRRFEQLNSQLEQQLRQKQSVIEQLSGKMAELEQRCVRQDRLNQKLKRQRSDLQIEQTRLMEQLTRAELTSNKTVIIGGGEDSRYNRQPTRHSHQNQEVGMLSQKITELTNQLQRCESAQAFPEVNQHNEKLLLKYQRCKHEITGLKSQLRTQRKEAAIVISNLQNQHDAMRCELDRQKLNCQTLTLRNLELTEHIKDLNSRLERTLGSLSQLEHASQSTIEENNELQSRLQQLEHSHAKLLKVHTHLTQFNQQTQEDLSGQLQKVAEVMRSLMEEKETLERKNSRLVRQLHSRNLSYGSSDGEE